MSLLVAFEPDSEGRGVWACTAPQPELCWLIAEATTRDYFVQCRRYQRMLGDSVGLGVSGRARDSAALQARMLWLREWTWTNVLEPLLACCGPATQVLFDTTTFGILPVREMLWSRFVAGQIDEATLLDWQLHHLYGSRHAEAVLDCLQRTEDGYQTIRVLVQLPRDMFEVFDGGRATLASELVLCSLLGDQIRLAGESCGVSVQIGCSARDFARTLETDRPGMLTILVAHQSSDWRLELQDFTVDVRAIAESLDDRPRGHWCLFVCHAEHPNNLAQELQNHGAPLVWTAGSYAYLRETLALLLTWIRSRHGVYDRWFSTTLTRARIELHRARQAQSPSRSTCS